MNHTATQPDNAKLERLRLSRYLVANLMERDPERAMNYVPIFDRLDDEVMMAESAASNDPIARARQMSQRSIANA